jgi:glycosyltransferase involved in cell wall biosynthesis
VSERIRVLVYGGIGTSACHFYRRALYVARLAELGVDLVPWTPGLVHPPAYAGRWFDAVRNGVARVDLSDLERAHVVLFSRWSNTHPACTVCGVACISPDGLVEHARASGHDTLGMDPLLRLLLPPLLADAKLRARCALMYDVDDDLFHQPAWVGHGPGLARSIDLVELFIRAADLVTVSTPVLRNVLRAMTPRTLLIRNAVEPMSYSAASGVSPPSGEPRFLFYGADVRRRDYALCQQAVDATTRGHAGARRLWLGSDSAAVRALVDEAHPSVEAGAPFAAALAGLGPHIGLAPLEWSEFASAKSELHWLEYTMAGAATVASRFPTAGPYDVIEDGRDGLLARDASDWCQALARLTASPNLRADIVARGRERILAQYQARSRATEWAAAYHWAAAHPGIGPRL